MNAWFAGLKPEWSDWTDFKDAEYDELKDAHDKEVELNKQKVHLKHKVEYRIIKNE